MREWFRPSPPLLLTSAAVGLATATFSWFGARLFLGPPLRPGPSSTYGWYLYSTVAFWLAWGVMSPVALGMAERYRFTANQRRRAVLAHLGGGVLVVWTQTLLAVGARVAAAPWFGVEIASRYRLLVVSMLQDLDWNYVIYLCIVGVSHAVYFHRQAQDRAVRASQLEARLAEAQLQALQRQLQPHFLFNTLHAIFTLVRQNPAAAEQMIERLSELLRVTLKNTSTQEVPLAEELTYLDKYLAIEKVHFGDRLQIEMDVPLGVQDCLVPYLVLQPLVENAIRHGLAPRRAQGCLRVSGRRDGDYLVLVVSDNGRGVSSAHLLTLNEGVGLANTRARLERLYGARHELSFHTPAPSGLSVTLRIPYVAGVAEPTVQLIEAAPA
jgi:two-component system LytT family sensor kinase